MVGWSGVVYARSGVLEAKGTDVNGRRVFGRRNIVPVPLFPMRVPQKGLGRWCAELPLLGGSVQGVLLGSALWIGLLVGGNRDWAEQPAVMLVGLLFGCWNVNAQHRALAGRPDTPYTP